MGVLNQKTAVYWSCKIVVIYFCTLLSCPFWFCDCWFLVGSYYVHIIYLLWHLWNFNHFLYSGQVRSYTNGFLSILVSALIPQFTWQCANFLQVTRHSGYCFGTCFHVCCELFLPLLRWVQYPLVSAEQYISYNDETPSILVVSINYKCWPLGGSHGHCRTLVICQMVSWCYNHIIFAEKVFQFAA
jgi:hypothetical protein